MTEPSTTHPNFLSKDIVIYMHNISKRFPGVKALNNVNFEVKVGEIHGLLGENGAGKTTLMKILCGIYLPDTGDIYVYGIKRTINSPKDAYKLGIIMVNQYPQLIDRLTVIENISLSLDFIKPFSNVSKLDKKLKELCEKYKFDIDLNTEVSKLSFSERQRVEILKALLLNAKVMVFDEPTTLLTENEKTELYRFMKKAATEGRSIILITHKLSEALEVTDRITILKNGHKVTTLSTQNITHNELVRLMFGVQEIDEKTFYEKKALYKEIVTVDEITVCDDVGNIAINNVSFKIFKGEILGIAGIAGNGQIELAESLAGLRKPKFGKILIESKDLYEIPINIRRRYVGYVPDRITQAVVLEMPIYENIILKKYDVEPYSKRGIINYDYIYEEAEEVITRFNIFANSPNVLAGHLSGGNLQKLVLAREIYQKPKLLIIVNPTRALDHISAGKIHGILREFKDQGRAVLLISEDLDEILSVSDRIGVIYNGNIKILGYKDQIDVNQVNMCMVGGF